MFEDLLVQLDELGATYTEDPETGVLTIDISAVDKSILVDIIIMLNDNGYAFNITDTEITVEGAVEEEVVEEPFDEEAYLDDALTAM